MGWPSVKLDPARRARRPSTAIAAMAIRAQAEQQGRLARPRPHARPWRRAGVTSTIDCSRPMRQGQPAEDRESADDARAGRHAAGRGSRPGRSPRSATAASCRGRRDAAAARPTGAGRGSVMPVPLRPGSSSSRAGLVTRYDRPRQQQDERARAGPGRAGASTPRPVAASRRSAGRRPRRRRATTRTQPQGRRDRRARPPRGWPCQPTGAACRLGREMRTSERMREGQDDGRRSSCRSVRRRPHRSWRAAARRPRPPRPGSPCWARGRAGRRRRSTRRAGCRAAAGASRRPAPCPGARTPPRR